MMRTSIKVSALIMAGMLITASAGLSVFHEIISSTGGEVWYSSNDITSSGERNVAFLNQGGVDFNRTGNLELSHFSDDMSGSFSGFTAFYEHNMVNNTGGEITLSMSNHSMSVDKNVSITPGTFEANEHLSLNSIGGMSIQSELVRWTDAKIQKESTLTIPSIGLEYTKSIDREGTGLYPTIFLSTRPMNVESDTYITSE